MAGCQAVLAVVRCATHANLPLNNRLAMLWNWAEACIPLREGVTSDFLFARSLR
jgi:hypothetical protein